MLPQEIIRRKRDGETLRPDEIAFMVRGIADGSLSEGQIGAFAMAAFLRGMSMAERVELTHAMAASGRVIRWDDLQLPGPVLDKHSTGGVGDKVSLMLAPIIAACGGFVPMISGRGLGHTGGTLDKLATIPGYRTDPDIAVFRRTVREVGCAIIGQTDDLAPADRRLYAVRDVTATVESVPLITASILSKKLAAGLGGLVMDVKTGSGAFAADPAMARELAESIVTVATGAGLPTVALITDMDQVLGRSAGNAVEVAEAVAYLTDRRARDPRLHEVVIALAAEMLRLGGLAETAAMATQKAEACLADGGAAEAFGQMVAALGGPHDFITQAARYLPRAPVMRPCLALRTGVVAGMDARRVGLAVVALGGGRRRTSDTINPAVGLTAVCRVGATVAAGDPLTFVHAASESDAAEAIATLQQAIRIADVAPSPTPVIRSRIAVPGKEKVA
ncbi:MAG: thymidine phosphorylase [Rhodospirillales bacterium]|nr:thymidine phosphorylase [Rhodospirillales bacterium]